jgi:nucleoside-diphosphate-sugar epimerase
MKWRVMITGAAGGIGSTLAREMTVMGYDLVLVDNLHNGYKQNLLGDSHLHQIDIRNTSELVTLLPDVGAVIHLAAISSLPDCERNSAECISVNVAGTASVLEACRQSGVGKCIFASTGAVYEGNPEDQSPFTETLSLSPKLWYPTSKWMAEGICHRYASNYGLTIPILRLFNVFGPRQDIHRQSPPLINYLVRELMADRVAVLHGTGDQARDYVNVEDAIGLILRCLEDDVVGCNTYNVCTGTLTSVRSIAQLALQTVNPKGQIQWRDPARLWDSYSELFSGPYQLDRSSISSETNKFVLGSNTKACQQLGWLVNRDVPAMIADTMREIMRLNAS